MAKQATFLTGRSGLAAAAPRPALKASSRGSLQVRDRQRMVD